MLQTIAEIASFISCVITLVMLLVKPIRERLFSASEVREGQKCLLRSEIVRTYYRNLSAKQLHQYEFENLAYCYAAYKQLGGNSFIDRIYHEMHDWEVTR